MKIEKKGSGKTAAEERGVQDSFAVIREMLDSSAFTPEEISRFVRYTDVVIRSGQGARLVEELTQRVKTIAENNRYRTDELYEKPSGVNILKNPQIGFIVFAFGRLPPDESFSHILKFYKETGIGVDDEVVTAYGMLVTMKMSEHTGVITGKRIPEQNRKTADAGLKRQLVDLLTFDRNGFRREEIMSRTKIIGRWNKLEGNSPEEIIGKFLDECPYAEPDGDYVLNKYGPKGSRRIYDSRVFIYALMALHTPDASERLLAYHDKILHFPFRSEEDRVTFLRDFYQAVGRGDFENRYRHSIEAEILDKDMDVFLQSFIDFSPSLVKLQKCIRERNVEGAHEKIRHLQENGFPYRIEITDEGLGVDTNNRLVKLLLWDKDVTEQIENPLNLAQTEFYGECTLGNLNSVLIAGSDIHNYPLKKVFPETEAPKALYIGLDPVKRCIFVVTVRVESDRSEQILTTVKDFLGLTNYDERSFEAYDHNEAPANIIGIIKLNTKFFTDFDIIEGEQRPAKNRLNSPRSNRLLPG